MPSNKNKIYQFVINKFSKRKCMIEYFMYRRDICNYVNHA